MKRLFVAATGTGVGKTFATTLFIHQARAKQQRVVALKPVISGFDEGNVAASDTGQILGALGQDITKDAIDTISPWRFAAPLSPDMAAAAEGKSIALEDIIRFCRAPRDTDLLVAESAGGIMSPLDSSHTMLDWAHALDWPLLLVAGSYLGALSHTLTACEALKGRGIMPAALALSESADSALTLAQMQASLARFIPVSIPIILLKRLDSSGHICENRPDLTTLAS